MKKSTKFFTVITMATMAVTSILSGGMTASQEVKADSNKTTVYYNFGTVTAFADGNEYIFLPDSAGINVSADSCLLSLPDGTGILKATSSPISNGAEYQITNYNAEQVIEYAQSDLDYLIENKDSQISSLQSYLEYDSEWYAQRYGNLTPEEAYNKEVADAQARLDAAKAAQNVTFTLDTLVDTVQGGSGFDGCPSGGLANGGRYFFCSGGAVQALPGKVVTFLSAEVDSSNLAAELNETAAEKVKAGAFNATNSDVKVTVTVDGKAYEVTEFSFVDSTIDTANNDNSISIKFGNATATITVDTSKVVAQPEETPEETSIGTVSGRDGGVTTEQLKANNTSTVVQSGSAAATANKTVNEVIDILGGSDATAKKELVEAAVTAGNMKVSVKNTDSSKVSGTVNKADLLISALTGQEMVDGITGNDNITLTLQIEEKDTANLDASLKSDVETKATSTIGSGAKVYYLDVDLFLKKNTEAKQAITEFGNNSVQITLNVPKKIQKKNRIYQLIRTHLESSGKYSVKNLKDLDSKDYTYTVDTNKLCTMAFAYVNAKEASATTTTEDTTEATTTSTATASTATASTASAPKTGETNTLPTMAFAIIAMALIAGAFRRKRI